ncbi:hypothetical protein RB195_011460 [Necator americanus]|uniref:DRBM domain-containing protein n=1 Tax=Necator americanus TaxID=51031 RepID=A0ABR1D2G1_NECAM
MSEVSNSFSAWETLPEDEPPLCIAVRRAVSPPRHYEAVNRCGGKFIQASTCQHVNMKHGVVAQELALEALR